MITQPIVLSSSSAESARGSRKFSRIEVRSFDLGGQLVSKGIDEKSPWLNYHGRAKHALTLVAFAAGAIID